MKFYMVRPCPHCPFRTDRPGYLRRTRAAEIAEGLLDYDAAFSCHETTVDADDDSGERWETTDSQHCAGALIFLEAQERPNQLMRIAGRLGAYDPARLDMHAPVCHTRQAFVRQHSRSGRQRSRQEAPHAAP